VVGYNKGVGSIRFARSTPLNDIAAERFFAFAIVMRG